VFTSGKSCDARAAAVIAAYGFNLTTIYKGLQLTLQPSLSVEALRSSRATASSVAGHVGFIQ